MKRIEKNIIKTRNNKNFIIFLFNENSKEGFFFFLSTFF
jgi:hypothetical protein